MKFLKKLAAGVFTFAMIFNSTADTHAEKKLIINSASRLMTLYNGDSKIAVYPLGLGKTWTPTPTGYYSILTKEVNPTWIDPSDPEYEVPSGPSNPLGYRWMRIVGNYGIHGTNRPDSIGHYVSNGCIRMLEKDVEVVFDEVSIGTPVEITYNRVVVEKTDDGNVAYYIYPDGYGWQNIDKEYVEGWLEPYGVSPFASDVEINEKIQNSDGTPTYLGKPYNIEVNGQRLDVLDINGRKFLSKAVIRDTVAYIPAVPLAMALKTKLEWRAAESTLKTAYGEVVGYEMKKQIYCNADDVNVLFSVDGGLQNISVDNPEAGKIFRFNTVAPQTTEIFDPEPGAVDYDKDLSRQKKTDEEKIPESEPVEEKVTDDKKVTDKEQITDDKKISDDKKVTDKKTDDKKSKQKKSKNEQVV